MLTITWRDLAQVILAAYFSVMFLLMAMPSVDENFKRKYAGTVYGFSMIFFAFVVPMIVVLVLEFNGLLPIPKTTAFSITLGG